MTYLLLEKQLLELQLLRQPFARLLLLHQQRQLPQLQMQLLLLLVLPLERPVMVFLFLYCYLLCP